MEPSSTLKFNVSTDLLYINLANNIIIILLCWPEASPQIVGTLFDDPTTVNLSVAHTDCALGWAIENE
jgi:hypothetical protein